MANLNLMGAAQDLDDAEAFYARSFDALEIFRKYGHSSGIATASGRLARNSLRHGSYEDAAKHLTNLLEALISLGTRWRARLTDFDRDQRADDPVPRWASIDNLRSAFVGLVGVARILAEQGSEEGARVLGSARLLIEHTTIKFASGPLELFRASSNLYVAALGARRFQALMDESSRRSDESSRRSIEDGLQRALNSARSQANSTAKPVRAEFDLSPRELEVLALLVDGASNAAIASALFISLRTARAHVANILAKLDVPTRTAAASLALRRDIV
jgi:DNA-binding CsgD family transcriptional regulator